MTQQQIAVRIERLLEQRLAGTLEPAEAVELAELYELEVVEVPQARVAGASTSTFVQVLDEGATRRFAR